MCTCAAAKRRRKQAANGFGHLGPLVRPRYTKKDAAKSARANERARINAMKGLR